MPVRLVRFTLQDNPPARLDKALARDVPEEAALSRSRLTRLLAEGAVRVDGVIVTDGKARPREDAEVEITVQEASESHMEAEDIALDVVFEDDDLIVLNKPAGMVVHPAPGSPDGTLVNALIHHCGEGLSGVGGEKRPGIVHRIDKDTTGLLVVAKTDRAHHGLAGQFAAHTVERRYLAVCNGVPMPTTPACAGSREPVSSRGTSSRSRPTLPATRPTGSGRRSCSTAVATPSPASASSSRWGSPRWRRSSNAGSRPGAPTRSGSTCPIAGTA
jgi:23S rRNA pseudouridine1911/1915/1917 synthase